jgi:hypothetical protein
MITLSFLSTQQWTLIMSNRLKLKESNALAIKFFKKEKYIAE